MTSSPAALRFLHPGGRSNVRSELESLLGFGSGGLRSAVCFFREAGFILFANHASLLRGPRCFVVASVQRPTDLEALATLHDLCPQSVYIHLGAVTPWERGIGRCLMHSKVLLATSSGESRLWVGSHNLTASAIEGGNFEAALYYSGASSDQVIVDAEAHLEECRDSAELFDRSRMDIYVEIQGGKGEIGVTADTLVIEAESSAIPSGEPFTVHVRIPHPDFDEYFVPDRDVHLYLFPPGSLRSGNPVDRSRATLWVGQVTGTHYTELNRRNPGTTAQLPDADHEIDVDDPVPLFLPKGASRIRPTTQGVLRLDRRGSESYELYSLSSRALLSAPEVIGEQANPELTPVNQDMRRLFTKKSIVDGKLAYVPASGTRRTVRVEGYQEDVSRRQLRIEYSGMELEVIPTVRRPKRRVEPFFFVSKYHLKRG